MYSETAGAAKAAAAKATMRKIEECILRVVVRGIRWNVQLNYFPTTKNTQCHERLLSSNECLDQSTKDVSERK